VKPRVVLVCGGRTFTDQNRLYYELDKLQKELGFQSLVHGDCPGADWLADLWANTRSIDRTKYPPNWRKYGKGAGPIRNARMLVHARPELVIAFPGGDGTANMVKLAKEAGVDVVELKP